MKIGTTTIPFLPLSAVVVAILLVVLVLWGVRRARRHPAPAAVPGARPAARTPEPEHQPCAADWTGEVANGYLPPPAPAERPRTVADIVAERRADTAPLPVVAPPPAVAPPAVDPAAASDRPSAPPRARTHAAPATGAGDARTAAPATAPRGGHASASVDDDRAGTAADAETAAAVHGPEAGRAAVHGPEAGRAAVHGAEAGRAAGHDGEAGQAAVPGAEAMNADPAPDAVNPDRIDPATLGAMAANDGPAVPGPDLSGPSDEQPDTGTVAAVHQGSDVVAEEPQDGPPAEPAAPEAAEAAEDPVPPPWSAARSEHADTGLEPSEAELAPVADADPADAVGRGTDEAEPVSRAVRQALAARAVQRARLRYDDVPDDARPGSASDPEADEGDGPGREHPLTVVPSASRPAAAVDARDRLLAVLLTDPARAVGATEDLDDARDRIDRLGDVLRRRRGDLAVAVRRLHDSGLGREQIGRLAGMGCDDVATILEARTGDGADGNRHT